MKLGTWISVLVVCNCLTVFAKADAVIQAGDIKAGYDSGTGVLTLSYNGKTFATGTFGGGPGTCVLEKDARHGALGTGEMLKIGPGENRVFVKEGSRFVFLRRDGRNSAQQPGNKVEVYNAVVTVGKKPEKIRGLGPSGLFEFGQDSSIRYLTPAVQKTQGSFTNLGHHVTVTLGDPGTGAGVVAGIVRVDAVSGVVFTSMEDGKLMLKIRDEYGAAVPPKLDEAGGDWWAIGYFDDVREGMEEYAETFAQANAVKLNPPPCGYCTWYAWGGAGQEGSEGISAEIAAFASKTFGEYGFSFFQIDDGWQNGNKRPKPGGPKKDFTCVDPKGRYAGGMKAVGDKMRAVGITPGLWMLPFGIDHKDPVMADRVPMVVKRKDGQPYDAHWSGTALDLTRQDARDYVAGLTRRAVKEWGYGYLKLDGIHIGLATPQTHPKLGGGGMHYVDDKYGDCVFADPTMSNMQAGRAGLKAARAGAGEDTFILGCMAPQNERSLGMAMGLVDAMRVGLDIQAQWGVMLNAGVRGTFPLYAFNGRIWWNDPDPIFVREGIPMNEFLSYGSWVTLLGVLHTTSENVYPKSRIDALRRMMPTHQKLNVRPLDLLENDPAQCWVLKYDVSGNEHVVAGLFNWGDATNSIAADFKRMGLDSGDGYACYDYWSKKYLGVLKGQVTMELLPRSCAIVAMRKLGKNPVLIGTSRHVSQGAVDLIKEGWNAGTGEYSGRSKIVGADVYELRFSRKGLKKEYEATEVVLSQEDKEAGVTAAVATEGDLVKVIIKSPATREVGWSVKFQE